MTENQFAYYLDALSKRFYVLPEEKAELFTSYGSVSEGDILLAFHNGEVIYVSGPSRHDSWFSEDRNKLNQDFWDDIAHLKAKEPEARGIDAIYAFEDRIGVHVFDTLSIEILLP